MSGVYFVRGFWDLKPSLMTDGLPPHDIEIQPKRGVGISVGLPKLLVFGIEQDWWPGRFRNFRTFIWEDPLASPGRPCCSVRNYYERTKKLTCRVHPRV